MPATIVLTGRIAAIDTYEAANGSAITKIRIPNDVGFGDRKTTTWWTATLFGKQAEAAAKYLQKGSWATITGEPGVREYTNKQGEIKTVAEVTASSWGFVGNKSDNEDGGGYHRTPANPRNPKPRQAPAPAPMTEAEFNDEDLPF